MRSILRRLSLWLGAVLLLTAAGLCLLRGKYDPVIRALAQTQVKNTASDLINDAIARQISTGQIRYDRIVYFEKDLNGRITALKTNLGELNRLKTQAWLGGSSAHRPRDQYSKYAPPPPPLC